MKESITTTAVELAATNTQTGEMMTIIGKSQTVDKYYSIKKLTSRINAMDLIDKIADICTSPKDTRIFNRMLDLADVENKIRIDNVSSLATSLGISRSKLNAILASAVKHDTFAKLDRGVYFINPFLFVGRRVRSNELREAAQSSWADMKNYSR